MFGGKRAFADMFEEVMKTESQSRGNILSILIGFVRFFSVNFCWLRNKKHCLKKLCLVKLLTRRRMLCFL